MPWPWCCWWELRGLFKGLFQNLEVAQAVRTTAVAIGNAKKQHSSEQVSKNDPTGVKANWTLGLRAINSSGHPDLIVFDIQDELYSLLA
jgi:hypothetical protein